MSNNVIRFVDRHIFHHQAKGAFALTHGSFGIIPELAKTLWDLLDLCTLFYAHLMLIALVVSLFNGSRLFQRAQFAIPLRF